MKKFRIFLFFSISLSIFFSFQQVQSAAPSAYDLIGLINDLRQTNGLPAMEIDDTLMTAAQVQSDYLGGTYGTDIPTWELGHVGSGGTTALDRAIASGYSVSSDGNVIENWAGGTANITLNEIIYVNWNDDAHMGNMLHPDAVHVGAGVTEGDGYIYYIVNFGVQYGSGDAAGGGVASTIPTMAVTPKVAPVTVATPGEDGSIFHIVEVGQALWSIAKAYDVTIPQLVSLNSLSENVIIFEGQSLLIRPAFTPTPSPTTTQTPKPPTRTPIPARTAQAINTQIPEESEATEGGFLGLNRQTMGLVLILVCGVGLVLIVVGSMAKGKTPKAPLSK
jgi:LysM repeat protein